jgi:hypothetical protein
MCKYFFSPDDRENMEVFELLSKSYPALLSFLMERGHISRRTVDIMRSREKRHMNSEQSTVDRNITVPTFLDIVFRRLDVSGTTVIFYRKFSDNRNHFPALLKNLEDSGLVTRSDIESAIRKRLVEMGSEEMRRLPDMNGGIKDPSAIIGFTLSEGGVPESEAVKLLGCENESDLKTYMNTAQGLLPLVMRQMREAMLPASSSQY